jgi:pyruvate/2-oxoglutarate dehydrogenase complex dihydrolipoamide acyltransferase (E2) component
VSELFINEGEKIVTTRGRVLSVGAGGGDTAAAPSPAAPASSAAAAAAAPATPATQVVPSAKDSFKASSTALVKGGVRSTFETTYRSDPIAMRIPNGQQQASARKQIRS